MSDKPKLDPPVVQKPARSAPLLVWGLVLLLLGQWFYTTGQAARLEAALRPFSSGAGEGQIALGAIASLVGFIMLAVGVHRLASHVDTLAGAR